MPSSFVAQTLPRRPTDIQTRIAERIVVRSLPAPGFRGPAGGTLVQMADGGGAALGVLTAFDIILDGGGA